MLIKKLLLFILLLVSLPIISAETVQDLGPRVELFKVDDVQFLGLKKVEKVALFEKVSVRKGMTLTNYQLRKIIKTIYSLNHFEYVEAHHKVENGKNILLFKLLEKPLVANIKIEGNDEIDDSDITDLLKVTEYSILDINKVNADLRAIEKFYEEKGFYLASVKYELVKDNENVNLVYKVSENHKVKIKKIIFLGNSAFTDDELKTMLPETQENSLFSFLSGAGSFKELNFQIDIERMKHFYKTKGFLQVNVQTPQITVSEDKKWVFITIKLNEGPEFSINKISFQGDSLFTDKELSNGLVSLSGDTYSEENMRRDIEKLTEMYQDKGYASANVLRDLRLVPGENKVDIEFSFEKGKITHFGKIYVKGNSKTRDKVIRRELKIEEGALFSGSGLRESKENVSRLGYFERDSVVFNTVPRVDRDDIMDVEISLKETNTGQIQLGAGYSTATKMFLQGSISQRNFRGLGQVMALKLSHSDSQNSVSVSFDEPYVNDTKWSLGGDVFYTTNDTASYNDKSKGFGARIGHPIAEYTRLFFSYKLEDTEIKKVEDPTIVISEENGLASSVRVVVQTDTRNNSFEPSKGYFASVATEYTGVGGDKKWWSNEITGSYFKKLYGDLVLRSRLTLNKLDKVDGKPIPRNRRLSLGGSRTLRGYPLEEIGPGKYIEIDGTDYWYQQGGLFSTLGTLELEHPLAREAGLKWVVFFDAGNAYSKYMGQGGDYSLKSDYGFGIRWFSPIGVLRFEYAIPMNPDEGRDNGGQFNFDIGQLF